MAELELKNVLTQAADMVEKEVFAYAEMLTDEVLSKAQSVAGEVRDLSNLVCDNFAEVEYDDPEESYEDHEEDIIINQTDDISGTSAPNISEDDIKQLNENPDKDFGLREILLKILDSQSTIRIQIQKQSEELSRHSAQLSKLAEEHGFKETAQDIRETALDIEETFKEDYKKFTNEFVSVIGKTKQLNLEKKDLKEEAKSVNKLKQLKLERKSLNNEIKAAKKEANKERIQTIGGVLVAPLAKSFDLLKGSLARAKEFTHFCKDKVSEVKEHGVGAFKKIKEHMNERKLTRLEKRAEKISEYKDAIRDREGQIVAIASQRNNKLVEKENSKIRRDNNITELKHNLSSAMRSLGNVFRGEDNQKGIDHNAYKKEFKPMLNPMTEQMGLSRMTKYRAEKVVADLADMGMKNVVNNQKLIATKVALAKTFEEKQKILADAYCNMFETSNLKRATFVDLASGDHLSYNPDTHEFRLNNDAVTPEDIIRKISPVDFYNLNVLSEASQIRELYRDALYLNDENVIAEQMEKEPDLNVSFVNMIRESLGFDYTVYNKDVDRDAMRGMNDEVRDILSGIDDQSHEESTGRTDDISSNTTDEPELE